MGLDQRLDFLIQALFRLKSKRNRIKFKRRVHVVACQVLPPLRQFLIVLGDKVKHRNDRFGGLRQDVQFEAIFFQKRLAHINDV